MTATFPVTVPRSLRTGPDAGAALVEHLTDSSLLDGVDLAVTERTWVRVATGGGAEIWLITWPGGTGTGWHDHGSASGAFAVLSGRLTEYTWTGVATARSLSRGVVRQFDASHIHDVVNLGTEPAVSLHAYAPSLAAMTRYELTRGRLQVVSVEQRGELW